MGTAALQNISQILSFLKIEKLHQLLSDESALDYIEQTIKKSIADEMEDQKSALELISASKPKQSSVKAGDDPNAMS